jgi:UDP-GlcNAc3NAcA epimerase
MYDAVLRFAARAEAVSLVLQRLQLHSREYILATLHRAENTDNPSRLRAIFEGLADLAQQMPVVLPLHPRTRKAIEQAQIHAAVLQRIRVLEPLGYLDMTMLEKHARLIATDSGGVQKEAYVHRVPCVTLRDDTEWIESLEGGCNQLVLPVNGQAVALGIRESLSREPNFRSGVYGDGHSAVHIANAISRWDSHRSPDGHTSPSSLVVNDAISCSVND